MKNRSENAVRIRDHAYEVILHFQGENFALTKRKDLHELPLTIVTSKDWRWWRECRKEDRQSRTDRMISTSGCNRLVENTRRTPTTCCILSPEQSDKRVIVLIRFPHTINWFPKQNYCPRQEAVPVFHWANERQKSCLFWSLRSWIRSPASNSAKLCKKETELEIRHYHLQICTICRRHRLAWWKFENGVFHLPESKFR